MRTILRPLSAVACGIVAGAVAAFIAVALIAWATGTTGSDRGALAIVVGVPVFAFVVSRATLRGLDEP